LKKELSSNFSYLFLASVVALSQLLSVDVASASAPNAPTNISISNASPASTAVDKAAISVSFTPSIVDGSHSAPFAYIISATASGKVSGSTTIVCNPCSDSKIEGIVENLAGGVTYDVVVKAKKDAFETAATSVPFLTQSIPDKPVIVSAVAGVKKVTLTWTAPTNTGGLPLSSYKITATGISTTAADSATSKVIEGLSDGTTYSFKIIAVNANGESASGDFADAKTADVPDAPTNVTATVNATTISNSWSAPSNNNGSAITEYKVYLINSSGTDVTAQTKTTTNTSVDMTGVASGTYTVKVTAKNAVGESTRSAASSSVTIAGAALLDNTPTILPSTIGDIYVDGTVNISATSSFGTATFSVSSNPAGACTYATGVVTAVLSGTCTISATTPGDATYATGSATKTFTILKIAQTINFGVIENKVTTDTLALSASSSAGLSVSFNATGVCSLSGLNISFSGAGSCTITASQAGTSKYAAAISVVRIFSVTTQSFFGGGGGGGGSSSSTVKGNAFAQFKILDSDNPGKDLSGEVCVELYDLTQRTTTLAAGQCSKTTGVIDIKVSDGRYRVLIYLVGITNSSVEYTGEAAKEKFVISGLTQLSGSNRYEVKLKAAPPIPKPSPTPTPNTPKPTISIAPLDPTTPTSKPTPTPIPAPSRQSLIKNAYFQSVTSMKATKSVVFASKVQDVTLKTGATFMATAKGVPAKTAFVSKVVTPGGSPFVILNTKLSKAGNINLPTLKFTKAGTYSIRITYGKITKTIRMKVTK